MQYISHPRNPRKFHPTKICMRTVLRYAAWATLHPVPPTAHANIQPSYLYLASGNLTDANINRSPTAYLMNPPEERAKYSKWGDTDKEMVVLKIANQNLKDIGMIRWDLTSSEC